jgi:hypothetical protein
MQKPLPHFLDVPFDYVNTSFARRLPSAVRLLTKQHSSPLPKSVVDGVLG